MLDYEDLAKSVLAVESKPWCVHPNGTSVWTGKQYEPNDPSTMVCGAAWMGEESIEHLHYIAAFSPDVTTQLLEQALIGKIFEVACRKEGRHFEPPRRQGTLWYAVFETQNGGCSATHEVRLKCLLQLWGVLSRLGLC